MKKRYAVITDIHGNIDALNEVIRDIKEKNASTILFLFIRNFSKKCKNPLANKHLIDIIDIKMNEI